MTIDLIRVKRDYKKLVYAEDERSRRLELSGLLERTGGMTVWGTGRVRDIMALLAKSNAGWLLLDLELEDGDSYDLIPQIKRTYGDAVTIIVLSGNFDKHRETQVATMGAHFMWRKPLEPDYVLHTIRELTRLKEGGEAVSTAGVRLKVGRNIEINLADKSFRELSADSVEQKTTLTDSQVRILESLAAQRNVTCHTWNRVTRNDLLRFVWGAEAIQDLDRSGANLRKNVERLRKLFKLQLVVVEQHRANATEYAFLDSIIPMDELSEAEQALCPGPGEVDVGQASEE